MTTQDESQPEPPPEMTVIKRHRKELRLSYARAGALAGISDTWWRYLETGRRSFRGTTFREVAPADTLARMALALGVRPAELEEAGRADAAAELAAMREAAMRNDGEARATAEKMAAIVPGLSARARSELVTRVAQDLREVKRVEG